MAEAQLYIGIDGGGSKTRAILADSTGHVLGEGNCSGSNINCVGFDGAQAAIDSSIAQAFQSAGIARQAVTAAWLGLAGMGRQSDRAQLKDKLGNLAQQVGVSHDMHIALSGGLTGKPGIVLIAGTGSACYGINEMGQTWRCGGWGELADDTGSASWLGQRAMQIAVRQADGRLEGDEPMRSVFEFLGIEQVNDLPQQAQKLSREQRGRLAPLLNRHYVAGNPEVQALYTEATTNLAIMAHTTVDKLDMLSPDVVLIGGLARSGATFQSLLETEIRKSLPDAKITEPHHSPTEGALFEAYKLAGILVTEELLAKLAM